MKRYCLTLLLTMFIPFACSDRDSDVSSNDIIGDIGGDVSFDDAGGIVEGEGVFREGCPIKGMAIAREIKDEKAKMEGLTFTAIGGKGDYLLANERSAFIISNPNNRNAYYLYGGIPVDAIAVKGCRQVAKEDFEEMGLIVGRFNASDFSSSILRMFRGEKIEIINDGSDGKAAVVRVTGVDDTFWLMEGNLIRMALSEGKRKEMSEPLGIEIVIDYILPVDSPVLNIKITFKNKTDTEKAFISGFMVIFGDSTPVRYFASSALNVQEFTVDQGVPWIAASDGTKAYAVAWKNANMSTMEAIGVSAIVDSNQLLSPIRLGPVGGSEDSKTIFLFLAVGDSDSNSATRELQRFNPSPIPDITYSLYEITGKVIDSETGEGMPGVRVEFMARSSTRPFMPLDNFYTDKNGNFSGKAAKFSDPSYQYQLRVSLEGYPDIPAVDFDPASEDRVEFIVPRTGGLHFDIKDEKGRNIPAKLSFYDLLDNPLRTVYTASGNETIKVAPGEYKLVISRGYEYQFVEKDIKIEEGKVLDLSAILEHIVDTTGYLSTDAHVHAGPSPDNTISVKDRIITVAAEGLDISVTTDHEFINGWQSGIDEAGLNDVLINYPGEEVTAAIPEHHNMYPVEPDYSIDARGGYVRWYGLDMEEMYKAMRERGAPIIQFNHPYEYMTKILKFDNERCQPTMTDPTALGLGSDAKLWDWDFDLWEMMNGAQNPFNATLGGVGTFDNFMSFINHGYIKAAVGNSDAHNWDIPGTPRIFFISDTDDPIMSEREKVVDSLKKGRVIISTGAFAEILVNNSAVMGDTITDTDKEIEIKLKIQALPAVDVSHFVVFANCDSVLNSRTTDPNATIKYDDSFRITLEKDSSIVIAGFGLNKLPKGFLQFDRKYVPRFLINPVYVDVDGNGRFDPPGDKTCNYSLDVE